MYKFSLAAAVASLMSAGHSLGEANDMGLQMAAAAESWHRASWRMEKQRPYRIGNSIADKPHRHLREIARRTTNPGTPERRAAMAAAKRGEPYSRAA